MDLDTIQTTNYGVTYISYDGYPVFYGDQATLVQVLIDKVLELETRLNELEKDKE